MKIFLDCSDAEQIAHLHKDTGLIDGVTTNPTLMKKSGRDPMEVIKEISEILPWNSSVSAEVVGDNADDMLVMAEEYLELGPNITIKVPCTYEGLKVCKELSGNEVPVNVTLVFTTAQAILAAKAGATYVSPFVGRVYDQHWDGIQLIEEIADVFATHSAKTQVLAASIREARQVPAAFRVGADICTLPVTTFHALYKSMLTDKGLELFNADWAAI
ncbi:transaldolase [Synechococcus phage S-SSM4]|uniref:Transaldolase n=1 Tax=Synechococcus phage S-SSM4 TaxID=536466 RepID=M1U9M6_9CAUD|nr:transaldolase [Synechococcus phage S-SSM4]AGG54226.1 transaldolase [Synechococcus phage S-SSM4]AGG54416.1 transaldolase [Cyanophage S-SSM6b]|tara:strand:+ start:3047 stop:3694 length:648 start_codon:yes stop_codon:yes gene_type:complete